MVSISAYMLSAESKWLIYQVILTMTKIKKSQRSKKSESWLRNTLRIITLVHQKSALRLIILTCHKRLTIKILESWKRLSFATLYHFIIQSLASQLSLKKSLRLSMTSIQIAITQSN
ncbi:hypothetical protein [Streptococcus pyogenes SSI-1]|nr:hypothetical protein [Streptococcus pyogenes SSI-1]BAC64020.1 hypothetical protein [Streptococcus pyogenes SSI-1]